MGTGSCGLNCCLLYALLLVLQAARTRRTIQESDKGKLENRIKHSKPGSIKVPAERKKKIINQLE